MGFIKRNWLSFPLGLGLALSLASMAASAAPTQPAARITKTEAKTAFTQAMFLCLGDELAGKSVKDAPAELQAAFAPATDGDRAFAGAGLKSDTPIWVSRRLGWLLYVIEISPNQCEVRAAQMPVQETLQMVADSMRKQFSDVFMEVAVKARRGPVAYQFEHVEGGARYVLHVEGDDNLKAPDPDKPGSEMQFSALYGVVLRQPAADPPAFR
jgi:hypothetical protein